VPHEIATHHDELRCDKHVFANDYRYNGTAVRKKAIVTDNTPVRVQDVVFCFISLEIQNTITSRSYARGE